MFGFGKKEVTVYVHLYEGEKWSNTAGVNRESPLKVTIEGSKDDINSFLQHMEAKCEGKSGWFKKDKRYVSIGLMWKEIE